MHAAHGTVCVAVRAPCVVLASFGDDESAVKAGTSPVYAVLEVSVRRADEYVRVVLMANGATLKPENDGRRASKAAMHVEVAQLRDCLPAGVSLRQRDVCKGGKQQRIVDGRPHYLFAKRNRQAFEAVETLRVLCFEDACDVHVHPPTRYFGGIRDDGGHNCRRFG